MSDRVILTTSLHLEGYYIAELMEATSSECLIGMNFRRGILEVVNHTGPDIEDIMNNGKNKSLLISLNPLSEKISEAFRPRDSSTYEDSDEEELGYDRASHFEELCSCVPDSHMLVGELEYEIPHSPGLTWEIHSIYFVGPAEREGMDWLLYRINWDDNWGCYRVEFLAECKGYDSPKMASVDMLASLFNNWLEGEESSNPGWRFLAELREKSA